MATKAVPIVTLYLAKQQQQVSVHMEWDQPTHDGTTPIKPSSIEKYRIQTGRATKYGSFGTLIKTEFCEPSVRVFDSTNPAGQYSYKIHAMVTT